MATIHLNIYTYNPNSIRAHCRFLSWCWDDSVSVQEPKKFAQSEQTVSVANAQSIINSLLLSFPWSNHSTQQHWNPASSCLDQWLLLLLLPLWEKHKLPKRRTHKYLRPQPVGASGPVALYGPTRQEELYKSSWAWRKGTHDLTALFFLLVFCLSLFGF